MKRLDLSLPELLFVIATRAALAAGVGLLLSDRLRGGRRRQVGLTLIALAHSRPFQRRCSSGEDSEGRTGRDRPPDL
jgi:hypothetical protein